MKQYLIFDGGSNSNDGAYGSFIIRECKACPNILHKRVSHGIGTNNEAEYKTLISALEHINLYANMHDISIQDIQLTIEGDSELVRNQVGIMSKFDIFNTNGIFNSTTKWNGWKVNKKHLLPLRDKARELLQQYKSFTYNHVSREEVITWLGH